jgi:ATP-binding cassette, sub-family E, member 1
VSPFVLVSLELIVVVVPAVTSYTNLTRSCDTVCCLGCGICVKKCPFDAISIINLPKDLDRNTTHRYGPNSFKLHRLPMPRPGQVLGLVGTNGIGKSTALKILAGKMKPNLGRFDAPPDWEEILVHFRGSELQNYFTKILEDTLKATIKPQYVDHIPKAAKGQVLEILKSKDEVSCMCWLRCEFFIGRWTLILHLSQCR